MKNNSTGVYSNSHYWLTDEVFRLIALVRANEAIYNPRHKNYFCRPYVENFWKEVDIRLEKNPGVSLAKWTNLRITFRKEYSAFLERKVKPTWAFFNEMFFIHSYLRKRRLPTETEGLESRIKEALVQINSITRGNMKSSIEEPEEGNLIGDADTTQTEETYFDDVDDCDSCDGKLIKTEEVEIMQEQCVEYETDTVNTNCLEVEVQPEGFQLTKQIEEASNEHDYIRSSRDNASDEYETPSKKLYIEETISYPVATKESHNFKHNSTEKYESCQSSFSSTDGCKCNSDPDAMFLMSLLPDIQSLPRRDKGKFKIEIQKVIQNLLYPDDD